MPQESAVILLSGGLDSTTCLAEARQAGYRCYAISFDYGQRHGIELQIARRIAAVAEVAEHKIVRLDFDGMGGSALTDDSMAIPETESAGIPSTYVPARNTLFLSAALGWAEVLSATAIFIGVSDVDFSGYPDCRPDFIAAFQRMANLATQAGREGRTIEIVTPLMHKTKAEIIQRGMALGVDYGRTVTCYQADGQGRACGVCDACRLRRRGFEQAGVSDPTYYR